MKSITLQRDRPTQEEDVIGNRALFQLSGIKLSTYAHELGRGGPSPLTIHPDGPKDLLQYYFRQKIYSGISPLNLEIAELQKETTPRALINLLSGAFDNRKYFSMNDLGLQVLYEVWQRAPEMLQPFTDRPVLIPVLSDAYMGEDLEKVVPIITSVAGSLTKLSYAMENAKISSGMLIALVYVVKN